MHFEAQISKGRYLSHQGGGNKMRPTSSAPRDSGCKKNIPEHSIAMSGCAGYAASGGARPRPLASDGRPERRPSAAAAPVPLPLPQPQGSDNKTPHINMGTGTNGTTHNLPGSRRYSPLMHLYGDTPQPYLGLVTPGGVTFWKKKTTQSLPTREGRSLQVLM